MDARCLWDESCDGFATATYANVRLSLLSTHLFLRLLVQDKITATTTVFALYFY
jgi:hypothetical protein